MPIGVVEKTDSNSRHSVDTPRMTTLEHGNLLDSESVRCERVRLISALSRGLFAAKKILEREAMNTPIM